MPGEHRPQDDVPGENGAPGRDLPEGRDLPAGSDRSEGSDRPEGRGGVPEAGSVPQAGSGGDRTAEIGALIGRLSGDEDMDGETRGRLLTRLARLLGGAAGRAGASGIARGRWLAELLTDVAPRIPIRDLETLSAHHDGARGERLADELVATAIKATTAVGAAGGALAAVEFTAPPLLLTAPAQLVAETLVVASIEVKLIAELHAVHGVQVPGSAAARATVFLNSWARQRGVDPSEAGSLTNALGGAAKLALRKRLLRTLGRSMSTMGPFLTGAVAGGMLNRAATRRLAESVRKDLRRHLGGAQGRAELPG